MVFKQVRVHLEQAQMHGQITLTSDVNLNPLSILPDTRWFRICDEYSSSAGMMIYSRSGHC